METANGFQIDTNWTDLNVLTGIAIGQQMLLHNAGRAGDIIEVAVSEIEPIVVFRGVPVKSLDPQFRIAPQEFAVWVRHIRYDLNGTIIPPAQRNCLLNVQEIADIEQVGGIPSALLTSNDENMRLKVKDRDSPDLTKLEDDPFPAPSSDEAGIILENTDTGDRYRWSSTTWILIELRGIPVPIDYFVEVSSGHIPGLVDVTQEARSLNVGDTAFQTLWDHTGDKKYFTENTQLYASSSSALDVGNSIRIEGLNDDYDLGITSVILNGQTSVAIPGGLFFRVREAFGDGGNPLVGDVYIHEGGATTGGVPNDPTEVQSKIPLAVFESGDFASTNMTHNGFFTVPAGFDVHLLSLIPSTSKNTDVRMDIRKREFGESSWSSLFTNWAYSGPGPITISNRARIQEKADIEIRVMSGNPDGEFSAQLQFILREKVL